jgi:hypothetical protein
MADDVANVVGVVANVVGVVANVVGVVANVVGVVANVVGVVANVVGVVSVATVVAVGSVCSGGAALIEPTNRMASNVPNKMLAAVEYRTTDFFFKIPSFIDDERCFAFQMILFLKKTMINDELSDSKYRADTVRY